MRGLRPGLGRLGLGLDLVQGGQARQHLGRDVEVLLQLDEALLALLERPLLVALLREARLRLLAAVAQRRVDVAAEQGRDVHLHGLAADVVRLDLAAVNRPVAVLREENRHLRADARAGRAVGLAVVVVLNLDLAALRDAVDVEEAEAQALHAVGAAVEVDDREPGLPAPRLAWTSHSARMASTSAATASGVSSPMSRNQTRPPASAPSGLGRLGLREAAEHRQDVVAVRRAPRRSRPRVPMRVTR